MAATGEYTAYFGGTVEAALAAITTTVNRVTGIYERELAIRLVLVAGEPAILYTDAATDPYTNGNRSAMIVENQANLDLVIGGASYDIGHVFGFGGGGIASLASVCTTNKGGGVSMSQYPVGDPFDVWLVAHEMGHQFGANHTFNGTTGPGPLAIFCHSFTFYLPIRLNAVAQISIHPGMGHR